uniref:mitogen-activated protein kinase n=1 Tax=Sinocyclocheilus grahami TaxID=75366 RepID=A0A672RWM3_SINGR
MTEKIYGGVHFCFFKNRLYRISRSIFTALDVYVLVVFLVNVYLVVVVQDLKPGNLAVEGIKATRSIVVVTRWYRAPEVILNWMHYSQTVDIWSVGCIMAEMLLGRPLFKGNYHLDQLREIMKITGTPAPDFIMKLQSQDAKNYIRGLPKVPKKDLNTIFFKASSEAVKTLEQMLILDPDKRMSAAEALELPLFTEFREPEEETEALPYDHSMDNTELPLDQWKPFPEQDCITHLT